MGAKGALFLGIVLWLGAGGFVRWVARDGLNGTLPRRIRTGAWAGAVLLVGGSALDVIDTISRATGSFDLSLILPYVSETKHGNAVLARVAIVTFLLWLATRSRWRAGAGSAAFVGLGVALLLTFSLVSHAGAQPGLLPVSADLLHLTGVAAWGGALVYGAWLVPWQASGTAVLSVERAVGRLSTVGAWGVTLIVATGVYASLKNLWGPLALTGTPYGRALLIKLAVVAMVLGCRQPVGGDPFAHTRNKSVALGRLGTAAYHLCSGCGDNGEPVWVGAARARGEGKSAARRRCRCRHATACRPPTGSADGS